jgi:hypothetical protein
MAGDAQGRKLSTAKQTGAGRKTKKAGKAGLFHLRLLRGKLISTLVD